MKDSAQKVGKGLMLKQHRILKEPQRKSLLSMRKLLSTAMIDPRHIDAVIMVQRTLVCFEKSLSVQLAVMMRSGRIASKSGSYGENGARSPRPTSL